MSEPLAIIARPVDQAQYQTLLDRGLHPIAARVAASRALPAEHIAAALNPHLSGLDSPETLPDVDRAADRIAMAIVTGEVIGINTDFDVDGTQSAYVIYTALRHHFGCPDHLLQHYVGHRLRDGYGLSDAVAQRIKAATPRPSLVITADQGSADEPRIAELALEGIDTIVTDHHAMPLEGPPLSAHSVVSPAREDSAYPDATICGAMVSLLLMTVVRQRLIDIEHIPSDAPNLTSLLGAVAAATVADCVDLRSVNNRAVIAAGLRQINRGTIPAWRAFRQAEMGPDEPITAETLAFKLGPNINSRSRVSDPKASFHFMTAATDADALHYWKQLSESNTERRAIERDMTVTAIAATSPQPESGRLSIVYFDPGFSPGVHGIVASRVAEAYGRPCVIFSPHNGSEDVITGSARTVGDCHIKACFDHVRANHPDLLLAGGGHKGAGGLKIRRHDLDRFSQSFEEAVANQLQPSDVGPRLLTDGPIPPQEINFDTLRALDTLEPFGREFESPIFQCDLQVVQAKPVGDGTHLSLQLAHGDHVSKAIWFRCMEADDPPPLAQGQTRTFYFQLAHNHFRGNDTLQLMVRHCD